MTHNDVMSALPPDGQLCGNTYLPDPRFCQGPRGPGPVPTYAGPMPVTAPVTAPGMAPGMAPVTAYARGPPVTAGPCLAQVAVRPQVQLVEKIVEVPQVGMRAALAISVLLSRLYTTR